MHHKRVQKGPQSQNFFPTLQGFFSTTAADHDFLSVHYFTKGCLLKGALFVCLITLLAALLIRMQTQSQAAAAVHVHHIHPTPEQLAATVQEHVVEHKSLRQLEKETNIDRRTLSKYFIAFSFTADPEIFPALSRGGVEASLFWLKEAANAWFHLL